MSGDDTHRVQFVADAGLVEETDAVAEIRGVSRTDLIKRAVHSYLETQREDDRFRRRAQEALIEGRVDQATFRKALGAEELVKAKRLQAALETMGEGVPDPEDVPDVPSDDEFYGRPEGQSVVDVGDGRILVVDEDDREETDDESTRAES